MQVNPCQLLTSQALLAQLGVSQCEMASPGSGRTPVYLLTVRGCIPMEAFLISLGSSWCEQHLWWKERWIQSGMAEVFGQDSGVCLGIIALHHHLCCCFLCSVSLAALPHPGPPFLLSLALRSSFLNAVFLPEHSSSSWP